MDNRNNDSDKNVEQAIDDIFGSDFIEIDINNKKERSESKKDTEIKEKNFFVDRDNALFSSDFDTSSKINIFEQNVFNNEPSIDKVSEETPVVLHDNFNNEGLIPEVKPILEDKESLKNNEKNKIKENVVNDNRKKNSKIIIYFIIGILLILVLIFIIFKFVIKKEQVNNCSYSAEDIGYKITDEYKITHNGQKIKYVDGNYTYKAKNSEYENQVEYVKNERIPAIINSNGMPGFTYLYESGKDHFSVLSYLDFTLFEFDVIDKNKSDLKPISYITINSKITYDSLIKELSSKGYKCTLSK